MLQTCTMFTAYNFETQEILKTGYMKRKTTTQFTEEHSGSREMDSTKMYIKCFG